MPTREEFAQFLPTQRLIRAFEQLFNLVPSQFNADEARLQEISIEAGSADSKAVQATDLILSIAQEFAVNEAVTSQKATQAVNGLVLAERRAKSNGVLVWLSM